MREILFRGQTRKNGQKVYIGTGEKVPGHWVYGGIFPGTGDYSIIYGGETEKDLEKHVVYSETVGQYTGLKDKNGKRIFEGDIVRLPELYGNGKAVIRFCGTAFKACGEVFSYQVSESMEIIGNITDNTELLEK